MEQRLQQLRLRRRDNAARDAARSLSALRAARDNQTRAERTSLSFARKRRVEVNALYDSLIGKDIPPSQLNSARLKENLLNEKQAALNAEQAARARETQDALSKRDKDAELLRLSLKALDKADEILRRAKRRADQRAQDAEQALIDEIAERGHRKPL